MTLRESLGEDVQRIYEQVDALLDSEDAIVALFDGSRVVSYAQGFGVSPSQLEFLSVALERGLRTLVCGQPTNSARHRKDPERTHGLRRGDGDDGSRRHPVDGVLRLARTSA